MILEKFLLEIKKQEVAPKIPVQRYCTWSQSHYLTLMALLWYTLSLI